MKRILLFALALLPFMSFAQHDTESKDTAWKTIYRESNPIINDLVHTKLEVSFDFSKSYINGKEWLTLKPRFYPTDSVLLDAKGMEIKQVSMSDGKVNKPLKYKYDGKQLNIKLDRLYTRYEKYTLYFEYTGKPDELEVEGSAAITDAKGLYFINPKGEEPNKPTQIWTQGETESNSAWMITVDKPNMKTTQEIYMTVPNKYVTLSNGLKMSEKKNADGTRTDYWKMDLPHAPYLFFMGVGDFAIVKDVPYKGKEVSYYVERDQAPYAKAVFGNTPEMIKFFSEKLEVDYPWQKYAQIVGRDYVSGAMENTTATLHQESAYSNNRELADGNRWEGTIAHELFHQWFGDLVTTESWGNLTLNESFANYSEYLWYEYKYGKDKADEHHFEDMQGYLMSNSNHKNLVRFHYSDKEDMFDAVSYNKGGRILHMLRNYVGDDAFYKALNLYLTTHKFKTGEAHQLRLAFEEVTGKDMNWFWNQWYYGAGQPKLKISYNYAIPGIPNTTEVIVQQLQDGQIFKLPIAIDVWINGKKDRYKVWLDSKADTFYFNSPVKPDLINVDAEKILLAERADDKSEANYAFQFKNAQNYLDRREAIDYFAKTSSPELAKGIYDKFEGIRSYTLNKLASSPFKSDKVVLEEAERLAKTDKSSAVRGAAMALLAKTKDAKYKPIYLKLADDSSYTVAGAAVAALNQLEPDNAIKLARKYSTDARGALGKQVLPVLLKNGTEADWDIINNMYKNSPLSEEKVMGVGNYGNYLLKLNDLEKIKQGISNMLAIRSAIPAQYRQYIDPMFSATFDKLSAAKGEVIKKYIEQNFK